jgi:pRiA4b ORF-3-like protein
MPHADALPTVHQLHVTLVDARPAIWRRVLLASSATLDELNDLLVSAFDWPAGQRHSFGAGGYRYEPQLQMDDTSYDGLPVRAEEVTQLRRVASRPGALLTYTYTYDDDRTEQYRIEVEQVYPAEPDQLYPVCLDGGGPWPTPRSGRRRPGVFDLAERDLVNHSIAPRIAGRDLVGPAVHPSMDPIFAAVFPGAHPMSAGPEQDDHRGVDLDFDLDPEAEIGKAPLRPYDPYDESVLAAQASESALVTQTLALADWVGEARPLTPDQLLTPDDAAQVVAKFGHPAPTGPHDRVKDLPQLHILWPAAVVSGLIELRGASASRGEMMSVWQQPADARDRLDAWCSLLAGYLRAWAALQDQYDPVENDELRLTSAQLFYTLGRDPVPAALPALVLATSMESLDEADPQATQEMMRRLPGALNTLAQEWVRVGVLTRLADSTRDLTGTGLERTDLAALIEMMDGLTSAEADADPVQLLLNNLVDEVKDSPVVQLTPLGDYGLRRLLLAYGWPVPTVGDCVDVPADELLDRLEGYLPEDAAAESDIWLRARGEEWLTSLHEVAVSARSKDPDEGPLRRAVLGVVLRACGPQLGPLLEALANDHWLSAVAADARHELGLGPEPTLAEELWLIIDGLSAALAGNEEEQADAVDESEVTAILKRTGGISTAMKVTHPYTRDVLRMIAEVCGDRQLAQQLRRALGSNSSRSPGKTGKSGPNRPKQKHRHKH